jgi:hypothetical protein
MGCRCQEKSLISITVPSAMENEMTQAERLADPTAEPRGFTRMKPKTRHLRRIRQREYTGTHTIALSDCEVIASDGSRHKFTKSRGRIIHETYVPSVNVRVRHRTLRGPITDYIDVADRVGLNSDNVAAEYRYRRDNGYSLPTEAAIETNATFRGGDH